MTSVISHARRRAALWAGGCMAFALALVVPAVAQFPETMQAPPPRPGNEAAPEQPAPEPFADIPVPSPRPRRPEVAAPADKLPPGEYQGPVTMPASEIACRARLRELGVRFDERERLAGENGCLVEYPIAVTALSASVAMEPEAVLNCTTTQAVAEFVTDVVSPSAKHAFGSPLAAIRHGSAYVCRARNDRTRMSEHAFGNAIDFSAFELKDGTVIEVKAYGPDEIGPRDFLRKLRGAACGPFKTVLGPGTNADHAYHLHFDLAQRRRGGTYCK
jgi:hypothetical protein